MHNTIAGIKRDRLKDFAKVQEAAFAAARPLSARAKGEAGHFLDGVPMHWMRDWPMPFPMIVAKAARATLTDIDGNRLDDFCLGDTGSMFGHSPAPVARAIAAQAKNGLTAMLPSADALAVGRLLSATFGDFRWQIATTATDANRFALRVARAVTGRSQILVFNGCYHGTVDDTFVVLKDGKPANRPGQVGRIHDMTATTACTEFNDIAALESVLAKGDIACVITEPVLTNSCMVLPQPGFHDALRRLTREHGTLLLIDETHTLSSGFGGYSRVHGLEPDIFVAGKAIAGGLPVAVWGLSPKVAATFAAYDAAREPGHSGMGTTLSANPLQMAAMRANLEQVMTPANYARMEANAALLHDGLASVIARLGLPWHVVRVGTRVEFICAPGPLVNGAEAEHAHMPELEAAIHAGLVNRGCLIAPFHNMMLVSPVTTKAQVRRLIAAFDAVCTALTA